MAYLLSILAALSCALLVLWCQERKLRVQYQSMARDAQAALQRHNQVAEAALTRVQEAFER